MVQAVESIADGQDANEIDTDREAWTLILVGAESYVQNAFDDDRAFTAAEFERITSRALQLIKELRKEKDIYW